MCPGIVGIVVARTPGVPAAQPRLHLGQDLWLEACFGINRSGTLFLNPPPAGLNGSPKHKVEGSRARFNSVNRMTAHRIDHDVVSICFADWHRTIVRLQNMAPVVILDREQSHVGGVASRAPIVGVSGIAESDSIPSPAVDLKDAASRHGAGDCDVVGW